MGIKIASRTKLKASLSLLNKINSFLFEEECGELRKYTPAQKNKIQEAAKAISEVIKNG
jgi:hypothetical protein